MDQDDRQIIQSPLFQGREEQIAYTLNTQPWGGSPSSITVKIYDASSVDQSVTLLSGAASVSGHIITLPVVKSLTVGQWYRLEVKFTSGGNIFETWVDIYCQE